MAKELGGSKVDNSKTQIINTFLGKLRNKTIASKESFAELYEKIIKYSKQLDLHDDYNSLSIFWEKIDELEKIGKTREEILSLVPKETIKMVEEDFKIKDLLKLEPTEILKELVDPESKMCKLISDSLFEDYYSARVTQRMFRGIIDEEVSCNLIREIQYGLGEYILENGLNLDTIAIETIDLVGAPGLTINLYEATGDEIKYIATLSSASEKGDFEVFKVCSDEEKEKLLERHKNFTPDGVILVAKSGSIIEYNGGNEYTFIDEEEQVYENYGDVVYHKSYAEEIYKRIRSSATRYIKLQKYGVAHLLDKELEMMNNLNEEYVEITGGKRKFMPKDVEKAVEGVTLENVQKILDEMTGPKITIEETLEKGIGFDEH